jgi:hypothetical protein
LQREGKGSGLIGVDWGPKGVITEHKEIIKRSRRGGRGMKAWKKEECRVNDQKRKV